MTQSQIDTINWYKKHTTRFNDIKSKILLLDGRLKIITDTRIFIMGKRGGLTEEQKKQ